MAVAATRANEENTATPSGTMPISSAFPAAFGGGDDGSAEDQQQGTTACPTGEVLLATGSAMAMRMWQDEAPQEKAPHRSPYETLGYVVAGRAELTVDGETAKLEPGDSYFRPGERRARLPHHRDILGDRVHFATGNHRGARQGRVERG